jgi:hypothetical protein
VFDEMVRGLKLLLLRYANRVGHLLGMIRHHLEFDIETTPVIDVNCLLNQNFRLFVPGYRLTAEFFESFQMLWS